MRTGIPMLRQLWGEKASYKSLTINDDIYNRVAITQLKLYLHIWHIGGIWGNTSSLCAFQNDLIVLGVSGKDKQIKFLQQDGGHWWQKIDRHFFNLRCGGYEHVQKFTFLSIWLTHWGRVTHICVSNLTINIQIMACRLVSAMPLSEPMLEYC